jgi:hypothetical protein
MPWELGYSDGFHGRIAIVPITDQEIASEGYNGQEYLGLYPYVTVSPERSSGQQLLWVQESSLTYVTLKSWLQGTKPSYHAP